MNPFRATDLFSAIGKKALSAGWGTAKIAGKAGFGSSTSSRLWNTAKLVGIGAGVGAIGGILSSDNENPTQRVNSALYGALTGAGLVALGGTAIGASRFALKKMGTTSGWKTAGKGISSSVKAGWTVGKSTLSAASFIAQHPVAVGVGAAGIYGAARASGFAGEQSPTLRGEQVNARYNTQGIVTQSGIATPEISGGDVEDAYLNYTKSGRTIKNLQNSAIGLPFGLHQNRHGGG